MIATKDMGCQFKALSFTLKRLVINLLSFHLLVNNRIILCVRKVITMVIEDGNAI